MTNNDESTILLVNFGERLLLRDQGAKVRLALSRRLTESPPDSLIYVSFDGVSEITPSFVDEALGRLLLELGTETFRRRVRLRATDQRARSLVTRVLAHRAADWESRGRR
ncbi:MAG: STAS-like domain-containing protein [Planctomycetes bacterium]|nr:STAS-like domain-containing protein [Planctomycetota bacterium]